MRSRGWIKQLRVLWSTKHLHKGMMDQMRELSPQFHFMLYRYLILCYRRTVTSNVVILRRARRPYGLIFVLHRKNDVHSEVSKGAFKP